MIRQTPEIVINFLYTPILIIPLACSSFEINTTNPQASKNVLESSQSAFLIKEYKIDNQTTCEIEEAWIENSWKYELIEGKKSKKKIDNELQLVMKVNLKNINVDIHSYLIDWEFVNSNGETFGSGNGVFILRITNINIPDTFQIELNRRNVKKDKVCIINLMKEIVRLKCSGL